MPAPTKNDWNSFHVESFENKVNVLFYYLCQRGYNMQEIAESILHDYNPHGAQRVSCITRCYGFGGRNGGIFSGIGATREDIAAFVRAYPNGCDYDGNGQTIKAFLLKRVRSRNSFQRTGAPVTYTEENGVEGILWERKMPKKFRIPSGILIKAVGAVVAVIVLFVLMRGCSNSGGLNFFSKKYNCELFYYKEDPYVGNKKSGRPRGLCASIPRHSDGKFYALGEFNGDTINGYGIVCTSNIALQSGQSDRAEASAFDGAKLQIKMGKMKDNVLSGYGVMWMSSEEIILGNFKDGKLKKYGCKVLLDENGSIVSVDILKKDKVKKRFEKGTYKGITFTPEDDSITIGGVTYTISEHAVMLKAKEAVLTVNGRNWEMNLFDKNPEDGVYMNYILGEIVTCKYKTKKAGRIYTNTYEKPISYGSQQ